MNPRSALSSRTAAWVGLLLLVILALTVFLQHQVDGYPWGGDNALYLMHTKNLVNGQPYSKTPYVYDDEAWQEGTPSFPPGFPLVLAPFYAMVGLNLEALRDFCVLIWVAFLVPIFIFYRNWLSPWFALLAAGFLILNNFVIKNIHMVGTECLYLFVSFSCLALSNWVYETKRNESNPIGWGLLVGALASYSNLTRSIGIALMAGLVLYDLYRNRRITRFILSAGVVFLIGVSASNLLFHNDTMYRTQFRLDPLLTLKNFWQYLIASMELWLGMPGRRWPRVMLWLVTTPLAMWGLGVRMRRQGPGVSEFYTFCYLGVLAIYWYPSGRYLLPLVPLYFLYLFEGIQSLWSKPLLRRASIAMMCVMAFAETSYVLHLDKAPLADGVHTKTYQSSVAFIKQSLPPDARIASDSARYLALFTNRPSISYPWMEDAAQIAAFLRRMRVDYVLVTKHHEMDQQKLIPALSLEFANRKTVFENAEYVIFRVN